MSLEEEFRSQNSGVRIKTLVPRYRYAISRGFRPTTELLHHQIYDLVGVQKLRLFRRSRTR
ncbi:hypothetical protein [Nostoc sp. TCL240-02]|uniref:hypothetical protein n=1 Tax=Nostoc sp. TCL240-02 TaxID=2572090 RepID=UPI00157F92BF|nr:hypothetical protein [Nostoc sp. TCL240-02]QKQ73582.1 hypothetical protein FBB35_09755 [Nostoc sp. TCL240-02]